ncbi:MAG: hypothetical protein RIC56_11820 [Pseudomonadales bacterium]
MARGRSERGATVGSVEHGNSAVLVSVGPDGQVLDRRRVDLTHDLPTHPYHHEGSWAVGRYRDSPWAKDISLPEAVALVERVREAADRGACTALEELAAEMPVPIVRIAIRVCPELPPTIEARIEDNRAQTMADTVMYRRALAGAAETRGWPVFWYDREHVFREAATVLGRKDVEAHLQALGRSLGAPWRAEHKLATAAAIAAARVR